jgi:N-acetylglucosamine-6-phosphate deacetylase
MTNTDLLVRGRFPHGDAPMDIHIHKGIVKRVQPAKSAAPDLGGDDMLLAPALFDMQVNGAFGVDLQSTDLTVEQIAAMNAALARQGVARWMPTLITDAPDALEHKCRILAQAMADPELAAHLVGIHLEGPHIAPADGPRGAHPAAHVRPPDLALLKRLQRAANGHIRCITLAPELPGALPYIRAAVRRGIRIALGHHAAEPRHIALAVQAGACLSTHLGNGLATTLHRHHNPLWAQLAEDRLHASFIADLEHIPPAPLRVFARAKGAERCILVSDSVNLAGMKPGKYRLFDAEVELKRSGRVCLAGTELLAGSGLMLLRGVANMAAHTDLSLDQAFAAASRIPAALLGIPVLPWPPRPGQPAEFLLCKPEAHARNQDIWTAAALFAHGRLLHGAP